MLDAILAPLETPSSPLWCDVTELKQRHQPWAPRGIREKFGPTVTGFYLNSFSVLLVEGADVKGVCSVDFSSGGNEGWGVLQSNKPKTTFLRLTSSSCKMMEDCTTDVDYIHYITVGSNVSRHRQARRSPGAPPVLPQHFNRVVIKREICLPPPVDPQHHWARVLSFWHACKPLDQSAGNCCMHSLDLEHSMLLDFIYLVI